MKYKWTPSNGEKMLLKVCRQGYRCILSIQPRQQLSKHSPQSKKSVFSNHQDMSYSSTVKLQPSFHTRGMERLKNSLRHMILHIWNRLAPRSIVLALPLEAKPHSQTWSTGACGIRCVVPDPPSTSHTLNMLILLMKRQIRSPPPSVPPLPAPIQRHSAAWQHLFIGGQKVLHCFPAIHSSCLKVPASEGRKGHLVFLQHQYLCRSICTETHHVWTK